ncbi:TetR/AcrR family transcriptional regulator [Nocardioides sp. Kera G14]|uniref:TetR/AcrR family transcriptional regulator n=1 Tax=Nocardioides sp. Kera G14 TaxID=2884264 RepID=UPI001D1171DF|nr:TetR/AcrR family transcriptional regulator [Nocardioides sp. Kera G14]UDY25011.1 TetR/AcrR family transcriptional regulator [Nocardioides sp. Kera G14]
MSQEQPARERILDAAESCLRELGIRRTTMATVAETAGISRAWLYRHFPGKATLVAAALIRRDEEFWREAQEAVDAAPGFAAKIAAALVMTVPDPLGPLAVELRQREPEAFAAVIGNYVEDVMPGLSWFWRRQIEAGIEAGELRADLDVAGATEWVLRIVVSLVHLPGAAVDVTDAASLTRYLDTYLMPALV